jgi:non-ribosomal peptide synthetase component F
MTLINYFEERSDKTPNYPAFFYKDQLITYQQINQQSNKLANYILTNCIYTDYIGILQNNGLTLIVSLLAILKLRKAFIALPIQTPVERAYDIIEDAGCTLILSDNLNADSLNLQQENLCILNLDKIIPTVNSQNSNNLNLNYSIDDVVYAIYTSGSTGKPKGVVTHNRSIINRFQWYWQNFPSQHMM